MPMSFISLATVQRATVAIGSAIGPSDNGDAFPDELPPDPADAVDPPVLLEYTPDLEPQSGVTTSTSR